MDSAYTTAADLASTDQINLGSGNIGGMTLLPGLYTWSSGVIIPSNVTLSGNSTDVWIFQIAQTLDISSYVQIILNGTAQAQNIFWQVADQTTLESYSVFYGNILDYSTIVIESGASLTGRALSQSAVTLDANSIAIPSEESTLAVTIGLAHNV
jgi:hypothetical protein